MPNRTLVVAREAVKRGISVKSFKFLGKESTNFFSIKIKKKKYFLKFCPTEDIAEISKIDFDDKYKLKQILKSDNLPRAEGGCFRKAQKAVFYAKEIRIPIGG